MATNSGNKQDQIGEYIQQARLQFDQESYGRSFAFYLLILKINPNLKSLLKDEFTLCWNNWSQKLTCLQKHKELFESYRQGCEVYLDCDRLHVTMGTCLHQLGFSYGAIGMFRRALAVDSNCHSARENLENTCRGLVDSWHFPMLNDVKRNTKFFHAVAKVISQMKKKDVLDIGSGTGILSMCAAKLGANVQSCEMSNIMHMIATDVVKHNKFTDNINLINCKSTEIATNHSPIAGQFNIPRKVSVVVTETVDAGLFGEGIVEILNHAWENLLEPGGKVIPSHAHLHCRMLQSEDIHFKHIHFVDATNIVITSAVGTHTLPHKDTDGLTQRNMHLLTEAEPYTSEKLRNIKHMYLSEENTILQANFNDAKWIKDFVHNESHLQLSLSVTQCGYFDALVIYFSLFIDEENEFTILTDELSDHCWDQGIYPIRNLLNMHCEQTCGNCCNLLPHGRLMVHSGNSVVLNFTTHKDNLQLEWIELKTADSNYKYQQKVDKISDDTKLFIATDESTVKKFNDAKTNELFLKAMNKMCGNGEVQCILDMCEGLSPFTINSCNKKNLQMNKCWHDKKTQNVLQVIFEKSDKTGLFAACTDIPESSQHYYDMIIADPIEPSGLLRSQVLENLVQARMYLKLSGVVFPHAVRLWTQCIHSQQLYDKCIVNNSNTLGFEIAAFINDFQVSTYCNLEARSLVYEALSEPKLALEFNLNTKNAKDLLCMENSFDVVIGKSNKLTAILSWFEIQVDVENVVNTIDSSNHWKQAAIILPHIQQEVVQTGETLQIEVSCKNSFIRLAVKR